MKSLVVLILIGIVCVSLSVSADEIAVLKDQSLKQIESTQPSEEPIVKTTNERPKKTKTEKPITKKKSKKGKSRNEKIQAAFANLSNKNVRGYSLYTSVRTFTRTQGLAESGVDLKKVESLIHKILNQYKGNSKMEIACFRALAVIGSKSSYDLLLKHACSKYLEMDRQTRNGLPRKERVILREYKRALEILSFEQN